MPQRPVEEIARETVFPREMTKEVIKDYHSYLIRSFATALAAEREQFREASVLVDLEGESIGWAPEDAIPILAKALRDAAEDTKRLDWQPIETAPRDATIVLLWVPNVTEIGAWLDGARMSNHGWHTWENMRFLSDRPSHWMPLPTPPAIDAAVTPASEAEK